MGLSIPTSNINIFILFHQHRFSMKMDPHRNATLRAKVIEQGSGNTLILDIGMDDFDKIGAGIGDDILVRNKECTYKVLLPRSRNTRASLPTEGTSSI